jgi:hypothetical protein
MHPYTAVSLAETILAEKREQAEAWRRAQAGTEPRRRVRRLGQYLVRNAAGPGNDHQHQAPAGLDSAAAAGLEHLGDGRDDALAGSGAGAAASCSGSRR